MSFRSTPVLTQLNRSNSLVPRIPLFVLPFAAVFESGVDGTVALAPELEAWQ